MLPDVIDDFINPLCVMCDNGGDVISCEGKCLRSFHATADIGSEFYCDSLGFTEEQLKEMKTFKCGNCHFNQHQCYLCGVLGSSDKSVGAEVFQCGTEACGYFYHPSCASNALQSMYKNKPNKEIKAEIASGKTFTCPRHFCYACKEIEQDDGNGTDLRFAVCRRCPTAYHRKCLPRTIAFGDEGTFQRAWKGLLPNKILIYCMEHEIDGELLIPACNIRFPRSGLA